MSATPKLVVLGRVDYVAALGDKQTWYMRLGVLPRGFYEKEIDTITVLSGNEGSEKLLCHEYGHAINYPDSDHPDTFLGFIWHLFRVGFDVRAASGVFRWRMAPHDLVKQFQAWNGKP